MNSKDSNVNKSNKKKIIILVSVCVLYIAAVFGINLYKNHKTANDTIEISENTESAEEAVANSIDPNRSFNNYDNKLVYSDMGIDEIYTEDEEIEITELDKKDLLVKYKLPSMERMAKEDSEELMRDLQVFQRIEKLGLDTGNVFTPEYNWKNVYNSSLVALKDAFNFGNYIEFSGGTSSELNEFLASNSNAEVNITSQEIMLDETLSIPSNITINGNGVKLISNNELTYAITLENVENVYINNLRLESSGYKYGIYIVNSNKILIRNNNVSGASENAMCVIGANKYINFINNVIYENNNGGIFFNGEISECIIQGNEIYNNKGTNNLSAGIGFTALPVTNLYEVNKSYGTVRIQDMLESPHDIIVKDNNITNNNSGGVYSNAAYNLYVLNNTIADNEKEGMCLDYGTIGTYVANNTFERNGNRDRQTDEDLAGDYVLEIGRMEDGTAKAKLPAISIDNSAYNIIMSNTIDNNYSSGIKMVRSGYRNLIISNIVQDNNLGTNDTCWGFGIELGFAALDDDAIGLDSTADYENIIARNVITGSHYSGIFLADGDYCNDLIDNVVMDAVNFSIENHSGYFNSAVGNTINGINLDFDNYK